MAQLAELVAGAEGLPRLVPPLFLIGLLALAFGGLLPAQDLAAAALMTGLTLAAMASALAGLLLLAAYLSDREEARLERIFGADPAPCLSVDRTGQIRYQNRAARSQLGAERGTALAAALATQFASPAAVLFRLQCRAEVQGAAREDLVTRRGHLRLVVHALPGERFLWRLEEFHDRAASGKGAEGFLLPMLVANRAGIVLFSNDALRRLAGGRPKTLDTLFPKGLPASGQELMLGAGPAAPRVQFIEMAGPNERREIYLLPLPSPGPGASPLAPGFETLPVALVKFAADGLLRQANRAARELLALDAAPETPLFFGDLFEGLGRSCRDWLEEIAAERRPGGSEVLRLQRAGGEAYFQVTLRRWLEEGRVEILAVISDATALKTLEAQFAQSQKMQAIGQLAGGIAHDFNNLLTAIAGHCDLLLLRHEPSDSEYADLVQIHQNANRAAALVGQLLAFSRKKTLMPETLDLAEVLADLGHLLNRLVGERVQLSLSHGQKLAPIRADRRQLEQVIMNLVVNARDAMPKGGVITLETEALTLKEPLRRDEATVPPGRYTVVRVRDAGIGIAPDKIEKIFEPFYTTKKVGEGTGLGLSMAYGIVKQSGGFIFCDSVLGQGSVFHLYFPAYDGTAEASPAPAAPAPARRLPRPGGAVVLLVEDEAPVRAFAARALQLRGYSVIEASQGEEALKILADPALEVDLFVSDVVMPGMDGPAWVRKALETRPGVRVIFMSGYAEEGQSESQARVPNSVFLPKPFSLADLTETVAAQLS